MTVSPLITTVAHRLINNHVPSWEELDARQSRVIRAARDLVVGKGPCLPPSEQWDHDFLNTFVSLRKDWVWAASYRMGIAGAYGNFLLPFDRFTAGGATTVRGFEQDSLGPVDPINGTAIGGEGLVVYNQELRFPVDLERRGDSESLEERPHVGGARGSILGDEQHP